MSASLRKSFWQMLVVAVAYFALCRAALLFELSPQRVAFWPAGGFLLGVLLSSQRRSWLPILLSAAVGNLSAGWMAGNPLWLAAGFTIVKLGESLGACCLITRLTGNNLRLVRMDEVFLLYLTPPLAICSLSAILAAALTVGSGGGASYWSVWFTEWVASSLGMMLVAPLPVTWSEFYRARGGIGGLRDITWQRMFEVAIMLSILSACSFAVHAVPLSRQYYLLHRPFMTLPLLLWAALRFGAHGTSIGILAVAAAAVWGVSRGTGPFSATGTPLEIQLLTVLAFAAVGSLSLIVLAVSIGQLKQREMQLRQDDEALRQYADDVERARDRIQRQAQELAEQAERLQEARQAADAANLAKSQFLASMSHEIRTPMTAILGYADLLREETDAPRCREAAGIIQRNGEHLLSLINDILDISKIEAGKLSLSSMRVSPLQIVEEVLDLMRVRAVGKNLRLEIACDTPIPETIQTDPLRLRQILVNLVGNAIKFTEHGVVTVRLGCQESEPRLCIAVVDTGIGMTDAQIAALFRPFAQADASMTRRFGGTGLGLCISQRLAFMLGGEISVTSQFGAGSTFTVSLATGPLDGIAMISCLRTDRGSPSRAAGSAAEGALPDLAGCRVLLAEDGPDNQRLIAHLLRKSGAEVTVVENGRQAVDLLSPDSLMAGQSQPPPFDVLLLDMQMPEMDGYTAATLLRSMGIRVPVVALTANAMHDERQRCLAAGCDDYATKPIERGTLLRQVASWARPRQQRQRSAAESLLLPS